MKNGVKENNAKGFFSLSELRVINAHQKGKGFYYCCHNTHKTVNFIQLLSLVNHMNIFVYR